MEERILKSHKISIFNRSSGIISGVKEVISFDPNEIILDTEQGMLMIQGEELHVTKLTVENGEYSLCHRQRKSCCCCRIHRRGYCRRTNQSYIREYFG